MKILHVNFSKEGGAAIGVKRFNEALIMEGVKSEIFYFTEYIENKSLESFFVKIRWKLQLILKKIFLKFLTKLNNRESHSFNLFNTLDLKNLINKKKPDILHLHWIGNEMVSIKNLSEIKIPVVWTFHDMWPFCGGEHFTYNKRFENGYQKNLRPSKEKGFDINKYLWGKKYKYLKNKKINIICPSYWMKNQLNKDKIFKKDYKIICPYIINKKDWKISLKTKSKLKKKSDKTVIIFVATSSVDNRKGFRYLFEAVEKYLDKNKFILINVGVKSKYFDSLSIEKKYLGHIKKIKNLKNIYSSSDILVVPSLMESFGQVFTEAGICGLPSVAFKRTAAADIIKHKYNGYLAEYKSAKDLAKGINWCRKNLTNNINKKKTLKNQIIKNFSYKEINKVINLYKKVQFQSS